MTKRMRDDGIDFRVKFDDPASFKVIAQTAKNMTKHLIMQIARHGDAYFMKVNGHDPSKSCCLSSRLRVDHIEFPTGNERNEFAVCVDAETLFNAVDSTCNAHMPIVLEGLVDSADVCVRLQNPENGSSEEKTTMRTMVDVPPPDALETLSFDLCMELDLATVREALKHAKKLGAELLRITVQLHTVRADVQVSVVTLSVTSDRATREYRMCNETTRAEDGSLVVRAVGDGTDPLVDVDVPPTFDRAFPVDKVEAFVRHLPTRVVEARLRDDMPLMLNHLLGSVDDAASYIRFFIGSKIEED